MSKGEIVVFLNSLKLMREELDHIPEDSHTKKIGNEIEAMLKTLESMRKSDRRT